MVRKTGNIFLYVLFFISYSCMYGSIGVELKLLDEQGVSITKTGLGMPVVLEVIVRGASSHVNKPVIDGLKDFDVEQHGTTKQLSTVQGITTTKMVYRYSIRTQKEGSYLIGPVRIKIDNKVYASKSYTLDVEQGYTSTVSNKISLELEAAKTRVVVGEAVPIIIRFYAEKGCELIGIEPLELKHCTMNAMRGPFSGSSDRNGVQRYIEWQTELIPQRSGELIVPSLKGFYKKPTHISGLSGSFLGGMFDFGYTKKTISSNTLVIQVDPLPNSEKTIQAVGFFTGFHAQLNQQQAKVGEGVVLSLDLEGQGDLGALTHPKLQLPENFMYYESKSTIVSSGSKKKFEYIIQAKQEGLWEIPCQKFTFFDVSTRTCKELETIPLSITIVGGQKHGMQQNSIQENKNDGVTSSHQLRQDLWPLHENIHNQNVQAVPAYIFWFSFVLLYVALLVRVLGLSVHIPLFFQTFFLQRRYAFFRARKKIKLAAKNNDTSQLYTIFTSFIAERCCIAQVQVSQNFIRQKFIRLSQVNSTQWEIFFLKITEQAYAYRELTPHEKEELFKSALMWLSLLEETEIL